MMRAKRTTSMDVARKAGVSRSVVSAILNDTPGIGVSQEKRKAVLQAIQELGYQVDAQARSMRTGRSNCIAAFGSLDNALFLQVLQGVQRVCMDRGYLVLLCGSTDEDDMRSDLIDLYRQGRIDGIITKDITGYQNDDWAEMLYNQQIPAVSVEGFPNDERMPSVMMDYAASIRLALEHMYARVKVSPIYLEMYAGEAYKPNWGDRERRSAYEEWMAAAGMVPEIWTFNRQAMNQELIQRLQLQITMHQSACILSNWSRGAVGLYRAANKLKLTIGKELYVMAADNTEQVNAHLTPQLSSIEVPYQEMGAAAAAQVIAIIEGGEQSSDRSKKSSDRSKQWLPAKLVIRESI